MSLQTIDAATARRLVAEGRVKLRIYDAVSGADGSAQKLLAAGPVLGESAGRYKQFEIKGGVYETVQFR